MKSYPSIFMPSRWGMAISYRVHANNPADIYNGIMNTTNRLLFDKAMNNVMQEKWMERKKTIAFENVNRAINSRSLQ